MTVLFQSNAIGQNVGGGEDILAQCNLPVLSGSHLLQYDAYGIFRGGLNPITQRLRVHLGVPGDLTLVFDSLTINLPELTLHWNLAGTIILNPTAPHNGWGRLTVQSHMLTQVWGQRTIQANLGVSQNFRITGQAVNTGDIQLLGVVVELD